ncbi:MAG: hypothetical protein IKA47_09685 [Oscillospiraceae bacterium]|nr:hypothetical protein [Oscillospiraceae bacterium]
MKKTLITALCLLLAVVMALTLAACGEKEPEVKGPKEDVSIWHAEGSGYPELKNQVSWEGINAMPMKKAGMDITEARQVCVDFFRYAKTATWIPSDNYGIWSDATIHADGSEPDRHMDGGMVYGGLPYISWATGSIYRLMDYVDKETGVVNMATAGDVPLAFGNQCANGAYVGFARVINSANYGVTAGMTLNNGFLKVGDYEYDDYISNWSEGYNTTMVVQENGAEKMFECYAQMKAGDGIVYWTTAGHVVMIATDPVVVRTEDGKIDPVKSTVTIIDQAVTFVPYQHKDGGDLCQIAHNVDAKWTFQQLFNGKYLPFTFKEWTGEDPIEETEVSTTHTGDTITLDQLFQLKVNANYYIMDLYAEFRNANGVEVYKIASRPIKDAGVKTFRFFRAGDNFECWGSEENLLAGQEYTVKIYAQLGTGERPTVWEGKLAQ